uniref:DNA polymerase eta n=1 Tax=Macrostomum lignano TaxID=282301 RepID=A0A1I8IM53_9PLAT
MDCFYVQVELQHCPESIGKPAVVVQYTGAGLLAVSYEARALGVRRHMRLADAQRICPSLKVFQVPEKRGKADISRYRQASDAVMSALSQLSTQFQKASIDEAYVDLTERVDGMLAESSDSCLDMLKPERLKSTCMAVGGQEALSDWLNSGLETAAGMTREQRLRYHDLRLVVGACLVEDVRSEVRARLGYNCSAGLAGTKTLAKISAGANKPARQTLAPWSMAPELMAPMPLDRVPRLGGKLGRAISALLGGNATVADVLAASEASVLSAELDSASVRYARELCRGIDGGEAVVPRLAQTSLGCSKNFYEPIRDSATLRRWLGELGDELFERLTQDRVEHRTLGLEANGILFFAFHCFVAARRAAMTAAGFAFIFAVARHCLNPRWTSSLPAGMPMSAQKSFMALIFSGQGACISCSPTHRPEKLAVSSSSLLKTARNTDLKTRLSALFTDLATASKSTVLGCDSLTIRNCSTRLRISVWGSFLIRSRSSSGRLVDSGTSTAPSTAASTLSEAEVGILPSDTAPSPVPEIPFLIVTVIGSLPLRTALAAFNAAQSGASFIKPLFGALKLRAEAFIFGLQLLDLQIAGHCTVFTSPHAGASVACRLHFDVTVVNGGTKPHRVIRADGPSTDRPRLLLEAAFVAFQLSYPTTALLVECQACQSARSWGHASSLAGCTCADHAAAASVALTPKTSPQTRLRSPGSTAEQAPGGQHVDRLSRSPEKPALEQAEGGDGDHLWLSASSSSGPCVSEPTSGSGSSSCSSSSQARPANRDGDSGWTCLPRLASSSSGPCVSEPTSGSGSSSSSSSSQARPTNRDVGTSSSNMRDQSGASSICGVVAYVDSGKSKIRRRVSDQVDEAGLHRLPGIAGAKHVKSQPALATGRKPSDDVTLASTSKSDIPDNAEQHASLFLRNTGMRVAVQSCLHQRNARFYDMHHFNVYAARSAKLIADMSMESLKKRRRLPMNRPTNVRMRDHVATDLATQTAGQDASGVAGVSDSQTELKPSSPETAAASKDSGQTHQSPEPALMTQEHLMERLRQDGKLVIDKSDPNRPRFTLCELRDVLTERNELKVRLIEVEEELVAYKQASEKAAAAAAAASAATVAPEDAPVQGPINREPDEKLFPQDVGSRIGIKHFYTHPVKVVREHNMASDSSGINISGRDCTSDAFNDNDYCLTTDEYIGEILAYLRPTVYEIVLLCLYCIVLLAGLLGNALVIAAVLRKQTMRTATNMFLVNLALADFLVILLCLVPTVIEDVMESWLFGDAACRVLKYL